MSTQPHQIALRSYAKVNLGLHILGKRTDGYHEVRTVLQTIGLHDRLILTRKRTGGIQFSSNEPGIHPTDNLVVRAIEAFQQHTGVSGGLTAPTCCTVQANWARMSPFSCLVEQLSESDGDLRSIR
jgi:4-diphosphocytidyl-2C-methyl-D-erythritol kinase